MLLYPSSHYQAHLASAIRCVLLNSGLGFKKKTVTLARVLPLTLLLPSLTSALNGTSFTESK